VNDETIAEMVKNWLSAAGNGLIAQTPEELVSRIKGREQWIKGEIEWRDKLIYQHLDKLNAAEAKLAEIPVDALLAIEEIAPLVAQDVIGDPAMWMKAWDEVSPWLATLEPTPRPENPWMFGEIG
jgi:hypothetical protein